jgi:hypothetical protein
VPHKGMGEPMHPIGCAAQSQDKFGLKVEGGRH